MDKKTPKSEALRVNITPELKKKLEQRAADEDRTLAQIIRFALIAFLAALILAPSAGATLHMRGDVKQRHWNWAHQAQMNVPLADTTIWVYDGPPVYTPDDNVLTVPFYDSPGAAKQGYTAHLEKGLFLHELGHAYDFSNMTPARRDAFKALAGTTCKWLAPHCYSERWISRDPATGKVPMVDVRPVEMFAEMYAACAMGLTQRQYQSALFGTYGWIPPDGTDAALCHLIG